MELKSCHLLTQNLHCPPESWHQAPFPSQQPGLLFLPFPMAWPDPTSQSPLQAVLSHFHAFARLNCPHPNSLLESEEHTESGLCWPKQPTQWGRCLLHLDAECWGAAGRRQQGPGSGQPGAGLICTPLRLGKGLAWGQCNRYLICSSPSGSDGYWNMVMGVV